MVSRGSQCPLQEASPQRIKVQEGTGWPRFLPLFVLGESNFLPLFVLGESNFHPLFVLDESNFHPLFVLDESSLFLCWMSPPSFCAG